jgi:hypothetical protein
MAVHLSFLPFLQGWDGDRLAVRLVIVPRGNPTEPLVPGMAAPGSPTFADARLVVEARLVPGLTAMPALGTAHVSSRPVIATPADREALFAALSATFPIDPAPGPPVKPAATTRLRKYLPHTFRDAAGWTPGRTRSVVVDDSYSCLLKDRPTRDKRFKRPPPRMPWGKVIAIALRQPALAEALGITRRFQLEVDEGSLEEGGWLYCTLAPTSDGSALLTIPDALKTYAARIPPLGAEPRALFSPVLFPVAAMPPTVSYDELFLEAMEYEDGFAKVVHATQPKATRQVDEAPDDTGPVNDVGVRLGWDDEQIAIWYARQMETSGMALDAPLGVLGFHVDVRRSIADPWSSLCRVAGKVKVDAIEVADFVGEHAFEVHPVQHDADPTGVFWLGMYFANWHGQSLVGPDEVRSALIGRPGSPASDRVRGLRPEVRLRYGRSYEFRVRLVDHSGGGPALNAEPAPRAPAPIGRIDFRRWVRPRPLTVIDPPPNTPDPSSPPATITFRRPLLGYPMAVFTERPDAEAALLADLPAAKLERREVGIPDPDVAAAVIDVQVRMPGFDPAGGDDGYRTVYTAVRKFPDAGDLVVGLEWQNVGDVDQLAGPAGPNAALPLPRARDVRLRYRPAGREVPDYFGSDAARFGPYQFVRVRAESTDERGLLRADPPIRRPRAMFLQPERPVDPVAVAAAAAQGQPRESAGAALERIAEVLDLDVDDMTLRGRQGRRTLFGASHEIRHVVGPDGATLTVASKSDLFGQWLVAVRATIARDWSWDGLHERGLEIMRRIAAGAATSVGRVALPHAVNASAVAGAPDRTITELVFIDAIDPKEFATPYPREIEASYHLAPIFRAAGASADPDLPIEIRLPITTPPLQRPRLVSAGVALESYVRAADYSSTAPRQRHLWLELQEPIDDPRDALFCRVIGYGPDPELIAETTELPEAEEAPLPIDPEPIRTIVPGQSADASGISAMTRLTPAVGPDPGGRPVFYLMPPPPGVTPADDELFGFFTYELRVGHWEGWSTAQGRFGTPLRVTGVQHPAPPLAVDLRRTPAGILASATFANPVLNGQSHQPLPPRSEIWVLLYAQVVQADKRDRRNVLLARRRALIDRHDMAFGRTVGWASVAAPARSTTAVGSVFFADDEIRSALRALTLSRNAPLSCVGVELLPNGDPLPDPLGADVGHQRILRTSPLVAVPTIC